MAKELIWYFRMTKRIVYIGNCGCCQRQKSENDIKIVVHKLLIHLSIDGFLDSKYISGRFPIRCSWSHHFRYQPTCARSRSSASSFPWTARSCRTSTNLNDCRNTIVSTPITLLHDTTRRNLRKHSDSFETLNEPFPIHCTLFVFEQWLHPTPV